MFRIYPVSSYLTIFSIIKKIRILFYNKTVKEEVRSYHKTIGV